MTLGPLSMMVKSGEVHLVESSEIDGIFCDAQPRPRNIMVPIGTGYTIRAAV